MGAKQAMPARVNEYKVMGKNMANVLTGIRIICGLLILPFPAFSRWYYCFYLIGGFTDAIDGTVARKTGTASDFGSNFDTIADFIFTLAVAVKIISALNIPAWLIIWTVIIALVKVGSHLAGYMKYHEFKTVHSVLNKICGMVLFIVPLFIGANLAWQTKVVVIIIICILTSIAAIKEAVTFLSFSRLLE